MFPKLKKIRNKNNPLIHLPPKLLRILFSSMKFSPHLNHNKYFVFQLALHQIFPCYYRNLMIVIFFIGCINISLCGQTVIYLTIIHWIWWLGCFHVSSNIKNIIEHLYVHRFFFRIYLELIPRNGITGSRSMDLLIALY